MTSAPRNNRTLSFRRRSAESGNVFYIILIGIILFAALMYVFASTARQSGGNLTQKQAQLAADDILSFSQSVERGVSHVYAEDCSENDLNFDQPYDSGYTNADAPTDKHCNVFDGAGGGITWAAAPPSANDGSPWIFNGTNNVNASSFGTAASDLLLILNNVNGSLCAALNKSLKISGVTTGTGATDLTKFTGAFPATGQIGSGDGARAECITQGGINRFYSVLLPR